MRKIVINNCYGGFGLSPLAEKKLFEMKHPGKEIFYYIGGDCTSLVNKYVLCHDESIFYNCETYLNVYASTVNYGEEIYFPSIRLTDKRINELPEKERTSYLEAREFAEREDVKKNMEFLSYLDIERDDKDLVKVVEELGKDSFGFCSELVIAKIADDDKYIIDECDGLESLRLYSQVDKEDWK